MPSLSVAQLADLLGLTAQGDTGRVLTGANALADATEQELSFASGKPSLKSSEAAAASSRAGCLIVPESFQAAGSWALIRAPDPRAAFAISLDALFPPKRFSSFIHPTALVSRQATVAPGVYIGAHVTVGDGSVIGNGCVLRDGCRIGERVTIGEQTQLHPNVILYDGVRIGARAIIHANCVIGADGFGFALVDGRYRKFPQVGTVEIEDDVELGAGCCVDRASLGATRIGKGTKLDNLVHVAHNCSIGENVVIAAQTGLAGGVSVGAGSVFGGQVGVGDKARIEAHAVIGAKAGILTSAIVRAGEPVWGIPARPLRKHLKNLAQVNKISELKERIHQLGNRISELEDLLRKIIQPDA